MANAEHVARLKHSPFAEEWNEWRQENPDIRPDLVEASLGEEDLSCADLRGADLRAASLKAARLSNADLSLADLSEANLGDAYFSGATLTGCDLKEADLSGANLFGVNLSEARLCGASLEYANLSRADFRGADLSNANLRETAAVETNFANANLTGCRVYGISAWGLKLDGATQQDLIITPDGEPEITVDNIDVAQFVYLCCGRRSQQPGRSVVVGRVALEGDLWTWHASLPHGDLLADHGDCETERQAKEHLEAFLKLWLEPFRPLMSATSG